MTKIRIQPWRRLTETIQAVIIIGLPFVRIKGESALRFDVPALQLHFFGMDLWMEEFFIVLIALIFLSLLVVFITLLLGRIWCGWLCPQTVLADFTSFVDRTARKGIVYKFAAWAAVFLVSTAVAANLIWYFVSPYEFIPRVLEGNLGDIIWGFWMALTGIIFLNLMLLRQKFCATVCPYAKLQSTLFDSKTLTIAFDPGRRDECMDCMACVKACPVGIDIRQGQNMACIHCAECVDTCAMIMEHGGRNSLIGYFFGLPGERGRVLRQSVVMTGTITAAFLVLFVYLLMMRIPLDVTVLPNYVFQPRKTGSGSVINSYIISVKNRSREDVKVEISVDGIAGTIKIVPDRALNVRAGEIKKFPVYISGEIHEDKDRMRDINITVGTLTGDEYTVTRKANFIMPEER